MNATVYQKVSAIPESQFMTALQVLLHLGINETQHTTIEGIIDGLSSLSGFVEPEEVRAVAAAAKFLSGIDTTALIGFIHFSSFDFKDPDPNALDDCDGICPVCGAEVKYDGNEDDDGGDGGTWGWDCSECGASGKAGFDKVFDRHYNVTDSNGEPIPGRPE